MREACAIQTALLEVDALIYFQDLSNLTSMCIYTCILWFSNLNCTELFSFYMWFHVFSFLKPHYKQSFWMCLIVYSRANMLNFAQDVLKRLQTLLVISPVSITTNMPNCWFMRVPWISIFGVVASWLVHSFPDQAIWFWALARDIALYLWARHLTLTVPLSMQVYKWVLST